MSKNKSLQKKNKSKRKKESKPPQKETYTPLSSFLFLCPLPIPPQKGNFYFSRLTCPCIYAYARDEVLADSNKTKSV